MAATPTDPRVAYVVSCLRKNPLWQTDEILAERGEALSIEPETPIAARAAEEAERRQQTLGELQAIREAVWESPVDELTERLNRLAIDQEPDLSASADRLRVVLAARPKLAELSSERRFHRGFLDTYQRVLSASPRASAETRERVVDSFRDGRNRKLGRKMIALMRDRVPELCALEAGWLDRLDRQRTKSFSGGPTVRSTFAEETGDSSSGTSWWVWWLLGFFVLKALLALARLGANG